MCCIEQAKVACKMTIYRHLGLFGLFHVSLILTKQFTIFRLPEHAIGEGIIGVALGLVIPCVGSRYFRLEDVCIDPEYQRMGYGREFIELMANCLREKDCDSILLGTQREYPSHKFYLKNGFREIDSVLLFRELGEHLGEMVWK